jgi:hypothetical protein
MSSWYFGDISSRFELNNWKNLLIRFTESVTSYAGLILLIPGLFIKLPVKYNKKIFGLFCLGSVIYLLIFFDLNLIHDYYQIPLLFIAAFYIAVTFEYLINNFQNRRIKIITVLSILLLFVNCIWFTERWFYKINKLKQTSSEVIKYHSAENSLIIVSGSETDPRDPTILAPALRCGWSVNSKDLSFEIIEKLKKEGAEYLLIVLNTDEKDKYINFKLAEEKLFENKKIIRFYILK